jgi:ubiquinone/menaquinone biosynthesis C-methylase UbiE
MEHADHVALLRPAGLQPGGTWADLGAGAGAFTLALRELVGADADIHAVDRDRSRLGELERAWKARFGSIVRLHLTAGDFTGALDLPGLDGIVMANSLHFHRDKVKVLRHVRGFLKPGGRLLVVEYDTERGNMWVPYPFTFGRFAEMAEEAGFGAARLLAKHPSSFLKGFYSAACRRVESF